MYNSLVVRYEIFVVSAVLAAHANHGSFRQKDVRFLVELFSNWIAHSLEGPVLEINNTQILRYLDKLVAEGHASRKKTYYRLTRPGLLECARRLTCRDENIKPNEFLFLYYFVTSYSDRIAEMVKQEGARFPTSIKLELDDALDAAALLEEEIRHVKLRLRKLDARIEEANRAGDLSVKMFRKGLGLEEVAREVSGQLPFGLSNVKPLDELLTEIPQGAARWELETGNKRRVELIWRGSREMLRSYVKVLQSLGSC